MSQHYTRNTKQVMHWCSTCNKQTMHRVDDRRLGSCTEHSAPEFSRKQEKHRKALESEQQNPGLPF